MSNQDMCVCCSHYIQDDHKIISCKKCNRYTHNQCLKLKCKELIQPKINDWVCPNCISFLAHVVPNKSSSYIYDSDESNVNLMY